MVALPISPRRKLRTFLLMSFILSPSFAQVALPQQSESEELSEDDQIVQTLPIFSKSRSPPIFYTTFFPLLFEYQLPQWEQADLRIKWISGHSTGCNGSESVGFFNQVGCPSVYHYNSVIGKFFDKTESIAFGQLNNHDVHNGYPTLPISCEEISSHFAGKSTSSTISWEYYWKLLSSCPVRDLHKASVSTELAKLDLTKLDYMLKRFYDLYAVNAYNHYSWTGGSVYTSTYSALQSSGLLEHFVEMQRWSDSISLCHSGKLPRHLVGFSKLKETLNLIKARIVSGQLYTTSFSDSGLYYKLPLTDCTRFAKNDSLVIRTLVPLLPLKSNFSLIELQPIPFTRNFNTSSATNLICGMSGIRGVYAVDQKSGYVKESDCKPGQLCFLKQTDYHWVDPCLSTIFNDNTGKSNVTDSTACRSKTTCQSIPTSKFPLFSRLSSNTLAIVGYSAENIEIFVSCNGNPYKVIKPNDNGVLLVQLSCACKVVHKFEEFHAQEPCNSKMKIQHANFSDLLLFSNNEENVNESSGNIKAVSSSQVISEDTLVADNLMMYLAIVLGLFGFASFIWNIVDSVVARKYSESSRSCAAGINGDPSSEHFAEMAYRANRQGELNEDSIAYLVRKEQNIL